MLDGAGLLSMFPPEAAAPAAPARNERRETCMMISFERTGSRASRHNDRFERKSLNADTLVS